MLIEKLKHGDLTSGVIKSSYAVHNILGNGFQEVIYQRALEIELRTAQIPYLREYEMPIYYWREIIGSRRVDFLINEIISVELKAITNLESVHLAQALNYLEAYNLEIGLLINFGQTSLEIKRLFNNKFQAGKNL
jgi:GxxExxY protein